MRMTLKSFQVNHSAKGTVLTAAIDNAFIKKYWNESVIEAVIIDAGAELEANGITLVLQGLPVHIMQQKRPIYLAGLNSFGNLSFCCQIKFTHHAS